MSRSIAIRCTILQGLYWPAVCVINAFAVVNLSGRGFHSGQIGVLMALAGIASALLQPRIGTIADKSEKITLKKMAIGILLLLLTLLLVMFFTTSQIIFGLLYAGIISLTLTLASVINSLIFDYINAGYTINFGVSRCAGSVGFAIVSFLIATLLVPRNAAMIPFVGVIFYSIFLLILITLPVIKRNLSHKVGVDRKDNFRSFVKKYRGIIPFLLGVSCLFMFVSMMFTYMIDIIIRVGGTDQDLGITNALSAMIELPVLLGFGFLINKFKSTTLLKVSIVSYVVRGLTLILAGNVMQIHASQLLQTTSMALWIGASVYFINQMMRPEDRMKGQTYMGGFGVMGSVMGNMMGGFIIDIANVTVMLSVGVGIAVVGCFLFFYSFGLQERLGAKV